MPNFNIVVLPGDGIGPEVAAAGVSALKAIGEVYGHTFNFEEKLIGGIAIDERNDPYPADTDAACLAADAVLLGAVGGPKWDLQPKRPEQGLLAVRKSMGLFANLRPMDVPASQAFRSPLKEEIVSGADMLIVRELTGGLYFGKQTRTDDRAVDECVYTVEEIERVARVAFEAARKRRNKVTSVDKANVIETSRLWRETVIKLHKAEYSDVELEHALVDSMAMHLVTRPKSFDVIVTENMFGDILSDLASVLPGSIGLLGSASLGSGKGLYEPIHGSAPDIAGKDLANPIGTLKSVAMMLRFSLNLSAEADALDAAIEAVIKAGQLTRDLGGTLAGSEVTKAIVAQIHAAKVAA
ncbi:3-isopropylmalate dehydrogenase [Asticcacaulis excentricus]|uniref:3-isopropylmalate dehydrogenase n=1 Tax=Asticcacaulis excentricus (strain ATCC 15261 / DSM 4724 / KCTC 12464 / NCIMB 9791 / VKM B-1370 / CB 48) TaxID=573065 RepID=E8RRS2_ASTEC|nr:3-isopropylmalate dehydrogenase [Asticcacaulis excentricus]ADU12393.1 3-isopropylmalate dehydrogenase [Asticcacaulis excentricus CB 48]